MNLGISDSSLAVPTNNYLFVSVIVSLCKLSSYIHSVGFQTIHFCLMLALILPCVYVYTNKSALSMEEMSCLLLLRTVGKHVYSQRCVCVCSQCCSFSLKYTIFEDFIMLKIQLQHIIFSFVQLFFTEFDHFLLYP